MWIKEIVYRNFSKDAKISQGAKNGLKGSMKASNQSKMTIILDDHQHWSMSVKCQITIRVIAEEWKILFDLCQEILIKNWEWVHVAEKFVFQLMMEDQKQHRVVDVCEELVGRANNDDTFLKNIITGDWNIGLGSWHRDLSVDW